MIEFNPDGSIKLPDAFAKQKQQDQESMKGKRCIQVSKEITSFTAPKQCVLKIKLSDAIKDFRFISTIFEEFQENASVPAKLKQIDERSFEIEIGTDFRRCTDCCSLIGKYREFLYGNIIEKKGNCTFENKPRSFSYEDYFD